MSALPVCDLVPVRPVLPRPAALRTPAPIRARALRDLLPDAAARPVVDAPRVDPRQGVLTLVPSRPTTTAPPRRRLRSTDEFGPVATPTSDLPDARTWAARLTPALLQVASGARPAPQLMRHVSSDVYESLVRRHSRALRTRTGSRRPLRIRTVVVSHPADGVAEVSVVVDDATRVRAVALRFEGFDGRWIATAMQLG